MQRNRINSRSDNPLVKKQETSGKDFYPFQTDLKKNISQEQLEQLARLFRAADRQFGGGLGGLGGLLGGWLLMMRVLIILKMI